jgi:hypothetical protein
LREESIAGVPYWVLKSGTREVFHRAADLATSHEMLDGAVVVKYEPPRVLFAWPLRVGTRWEQEFRTEWPVDRTTRDTTHTFSTEGEEYVTVPAGMFHTVKIVQRVKQTRVLGTELWYSPDVMNWVKMREGLRNPRTRELIAYRLKKERW